MRISDREEPDDIDAGSPVLCFEVDERHAGQRLDKSLAALLPEISRSRLQGWVLKGAVRVNGVQVKSRHELALGDLIELEEQPAPDAAAFKPEPIPLAIVHEDDALMVIDKPPGLVVHPAAGHWSGTLLNGLLAHEPALMTLPRAGIVHRLDADTSGLLVVAKTAAAHTELVRQMQARSVLREYWALVRGETAVSGTIDTPIARDPRHPLRFRVSQAANAKAACTHYKRLQTAVADDTVISWLACRLDTGRTHQIRVHLESIGHPLIGDPIYRRGLPPRIEDPLDWRGFRRQALHACRLALVHPADGLQYTWFRPPPQDLLKLMRALKFKPLSRPSAAF